MEDMKVAAQKFMNEHGIKTCYECDGKIFKHDHNAAARSLMSGKEVITHTANAGASASTNE